MNFQITQISVGSHENLPNCVTRCWSKEWTNIRASDTFFKYTYAKPIIHLHGGWSVLITSVCFSFFVCSTFGVKFNQKSGLSEELVVFRETKFFEWRKKLACRVGVKKTCIRLCFTDWALAVITMPFEILYWVWKLWVLFLSVHRRFPLWNRDIWPPIVVSFLFVYATRINVNLCIWPELRTYRLLIFCVSHRIYRHNGNVRLYASEMGGIWFELEFECTESDQKAKFRAEIASGSTKL